MRRFLLATSLLLAACRRPVEVPAPAPAFDVAVFGDMPYIPEPDTARAGDGIMRQYERVLADIRAAGPAFVVHVGDLTGFHCSDSVLARREADFASLPAPVVYVFGDNEWIDCRRNGFEPLERLARLRERFTRGDSSLGGRPMPLVRQSADARFAAFRENVRWERGGIVFVGLHVVPEPRDWARDPAQLQESAARAAAAISWLRDGFALATSRRARGIAVFLQANMGWGTDMRPEFVAVRGELTRLAQRFPGQVAVVHGDTHRCRADHAIVDAGGRALPNVTRAESFGDPRHHWLRMTVAPASDTIFRFAPAFVAGNAPATCELFGREAAAPAVR